MCSIQAFPALAADDNFLAYIIAAPLYWTQGTNSLLYHSDETRSKAGFPLTVQLERSGYIVGE
jgi:hypothetical protein